MKKMVLSILLVVLLIFCTSGAGFTSSLGDIADSPYRESIESMAELGVLEGRGDGKFWPKENLTRAEAAKVAAYLMGFSERDAHEAKSRDQVFADVYVGMGAHEWAVGWINLIAQEGIIEGFGDGSYYPGEKLQMAQWAAILIRILGYEEEGMAWPTGYDELAGQLGLTEGLPYQSQTQVNREQMAHFTSRAVHHVECSDGNRLADRLRQMLEDREEEPVEALSVEVQANPAAVPAGGGKTVILSVSVTDDLGRPVEGADVGFYAEAFENGERNSQLSPSETATDASGLASATYTTKAEDDQRFVFFNISVGKDSVMEHRQLQIAAADAAANVSGVVLDPYTGEPARDIHIHFERPDLGRSIGFAVTDSAGRYEAVVPTGSYKLSFGMEIPDAITASFTSDGGNYTVDNKKGILKGVITGASSGSDVMAISPDFNRSDLANHTLQAKIGDDGSFVLALFPQTYELCIVGRASAFKTGVTVKAGQVTDIGTVNVK